MDTTENLSSGSFIKVSCNEESKMVSGNFLYSVFVCVHTHIYLSISVSCTLNHSFIHA